MTGTLTPGRPCPQKSGGSDPPYGSDPEKAEDDMADKRGIRCALQTSATLPEHALVQILAQVRLAPVVFGQRCLGCGAVRT